MLLDPTFLSPVTALCGALTGGGASLVGAIYTQRRQQRLQRIAAEASKREQVYGDFVMSASKILLNAYVHDDLSLGTDELRLVALINRMRLFAPPAVIAGAEVVLKAIVEIALKPGIEFRQLAVEALSKRLGPDPLQEFSRVCRTDLDNVHRNMA